MFTDSLFEAILLYTYNFYNIYNNQLLKVKANLNIDGIMRLFNLHMKNMFLAEYFIL